MPLAVERIFILSLKNSPYSLMDKAQPSGG